MTNYYCNACGRRDGSRTSIFAHWREYHASDEKHPEKPQISQSPPANTQEYDPQRTEADKADRWSGVNVRARRKAREDDDSSERWQEIARNGGNHRSTDDSESEILARNRRGHGANADRRVRDSAEAAQEVEREHLAQIRERYGGRFE